MIAGLSLFADAATRTTFELHRIQSVTDWIAPLVVFAVLSWFVIGMYLLDCVELGVRRAVLLGGLRLLALVGLLAIYLQPQWREEHDMVSNSQVVILADTSQSMQRADIVDDASVGTTTGGPQTRSEVVINELTQGDFLPRLRKTHDVHVYRFDQDDAPTPIATLAKFPQTEDTEAATTVDAQAQQASVDSAQGQLISASVALAAGFLVLVIYSMRKSGEDRPAAVLLIVGTILILGAFSLGVWSFTAHDGVSVRQMLSLPDVKEAEDSNDDEPQQDVTVDWNEELQARGSETRLGTSLARLIEEKRSGSLSGVVVLSDGQENAGIDTTEAAQLAAEADVPVHTIGFGSARKPQFVGIGDYAAPGRAMPDDPFEVSVYLHSRGYKDRKATVVLQQVEDDNAIAPTEDLGVFEEAKVTLGEEDENISQKFIIEGISTPGRYAFELGVIPPGETQVAELSRERFYVEVVLRKTKVFLIAGGPTREYRFLRNMLYRDKTSEVDVYLQSARDAVSQDANNVLTEFPKQIEKLFDYDCIVAFDPDWTALSAEQIDILTRWVSDEAGGLIVIPSLVHAGNPVSSWIHDPRTRDIQDMYPVVFHERFAQLNFQRGSAEKPAAISLTREGMAAEFLRPDKTKDSKQDDLRIWDRFLGVYGAYPVVGPKPGTTVFAHYDNPVPLSAGDQPIYMASHFFGAGRVFYLGSGELWRLRRFGEAKFDQLYINLVRYAAQGRLLRGSRRGDILLLEQSRYFVGDNVPVVAHLKNDQRQPLKVDEVTLFIFSPDGKTTQLALKPDANKEGMYRGQFPVRQRGDYRLALPLPESEEDPLSKMISVASSAAEDQRPERNDEVLGSLAKTTGGTYFVGFDAAMGSGGGESLFSLLTDQTQVTPQFGDTDQAWDQFWATWMMFFVCGILCLEWLLRRLLKLA